MKAGRKMTDADRVGVYEYRAPKVTQPEKRVSQESLQKAFVTRWIKNHREVAGVFVRKQPTKKSLVAVRKVALGFYPEWVTEPWQRFLFPRTARVTYKPGQRVPLDKALDFEIDHTQMFEWHQAAYTTLQRNAHPDLSFFLSRSGKRLTKRTFAECLLQYSRRRWPGDRGDERAQSCILGILEYAERDLRESATPNKNRCKRKFTTRSLTGYWSWLLSRLHGTDRFAHPSEAKAAFGTVEYRDELDHGPTVDGHD
jgi:hypothetical protein